MMHPTRTSGFLAGVFLVCMTTLMLQILQTRVLSVITWYHLAFLAISMAMSGMTLGALIVHFRPLRFTAERIEDDLARLTLAFAISIAVSAALLATTAVLAAPRMLVMSALVWLKVILVLLPPYVFAGMAVSLALTRSPLPIGIVYAADLIGAAAGCLATFAVLNWLDGASALLAAATLAAAGAVCFDAARPAPHRTSTIWRARSSAALAILAAATVLNFLAQPGGLTFVFVKDSVDVPADALEVRWNTFSRIRVGRPYLDVPFLWGGSALAPTDRLEQLHMNIDGEASTPVYRFTKSVNELDFLRYDLTNLAYWIRHSGRAAVIGVGGGRDVLAAHLFGFNDVTGVELNPIFLDLLHGRLREFSPVVDLPGVRLINEEARSWFARTDDRFDLIQMSLIDTWASTGVGAYSLSENGLYTVEAWRRFFERLTPSGLFTVSRWFSPANVDESARAVSLAKAALFEMGQAEPDRHIVLVGQSRIATLIVGREPLGSGDLQALRSHAERLGFRVFVAPDAPPMTSIFAAIRNAPSTSALQRLTRQYPLDLSPPTDDSPFFFNQLRMRDLDSVRYAFSSPGGVIRGNLVASITLLVIIGISGLLVLLVVLLPARHAARSAGSTFVAAGTLYFVLIGLGFMFVEIGLIQRMSIFLGHPVHGLVVVLFGIILFTGIGSLASDRWPLRTRRQIASWSLTLGLYVLSLPWWLPLLTSRFETSGLAVRVLLCVSAIGPAALMMGFGFPTGLRLTGRIATGPLPWFWAVNGAAGVLASGAALMVALEASIDATLVIGAGCYLLVAGPALRIQALSAERSTRPSSARAGTA
jgi:hypothetical protein